MGEERGFTLVEIMVSLTIFAFIFTFVALLYARSYAGYTRNSQQVEVQENLRRAAAVMSSKIRAKEEQTNAVRFPASTEINWGSYDKGSGNFICRGGFRLDPGGHEIEEFINGAWLPIASDIDSLKFTCNSATGHILIKLTGSKGRNGRVELSTGVRISPGVEVVP